MSVNKRLYSRQFVHPVTLISVSNGERENLATMAWVSPVSFEPPMLMVAVSPKRFTHELVLDAKEFAIMVLSNLQKELATLAGTSTGRKVNKWELEPFKRLRRNAQFIQAPILEKCRATYECKLVNHIETGDHTLFIGEIIHAEFDEEINPLILFNRNYYDIGKLIAKYP